MKKHDRLGECRSLTTMFSSIGSTVNEERKPGCVDAAIYFAKSLTLITDSWD